MMYSLLKETKFCQVCKKSFPNGKALGGHMRSHTQKLSAPVADSSTGSTTVSLQASSKLQASFGPHETVLVRSVYTGKAVAGPKPDLKRDEGGQQITGKRKIVVDLDKLNSTESQSCLTAEEGAYCLVEMSKGRRPENRQSPKVIDGCSVPTQKGKENYTEKYIDIDSEDVHQGSYKHVDEDENVKTLTSNVGILIEDNDKEDDDDDDDDGDDETYVVAEEKKCKKKYMCDICGKALRSYQALGGHRTSHRNKRLKICDKNDQAVRPEHGTAVRRHYECQICGRVFESGQALGGHKKVHYFFLQPMK